MRPARFCFDRRRNIDYILSLMDWPANVDPHYKKTYFRPPLPSEKPDDGADEKWITYARIE